MTKLYGRLVLLGFVLLLLGSLSPLSAKCKCNKSSFNPFIKTNRIIETGERVFVKFNMDLYDAAFRAQYATDPLAVRPTDLSILRSDATNFGALFTCLGSDVSSTVTTLFNRYIDAALAYVDSTVLSTGSSAALSTWQSAGQSLGAYIQSLTRKSCCSNLDFTRVFNDYTNTLATLFTDLSPILAPPSIFTTQTMTLLQEEPPPLVKTPRNPRTAQETYVITFRTFTAPIGGGTAVVGSGGTTGGGAFPTTPF